MTSIDKINALVDKYSLSETVKQEIIKILEKACDDAYEKGRDDLYDEIRWINL
jgi:hypothetical protein